MSGRLRPILAALAAVTALTSACTADVLTTVEITSAHAATITVQARFTGEAADLIAAEGEPRDGITALFAGRTGQEPHITSGEGETVVTAEVGYDQLADASDLVGVKALAVAETDQGVLLSADVVPPSALAEAIAETAEGQPDAGPLAETMLAATQVTLKVTYPGDIVSASGVDGVVVEDGGFLSGDTAVLTRTVGADTAGTLQVTGSVSSHRTRALLLGGGVVLAAGAGLWWRRTTRPTTPPAPAAGYAYQPGHPHTP
jgi:hypothetical protein